MKNIDVYLFFNLSIVLTILIMAKRDGIKLRKIALLLFVSLSLIGCSTLDTDSSDNYSSLQALQTATAQNDIGTSSGEDTVGPMISIRQNTVVLTAVDKESVRQNILSVYDKVDGTLEYSSFERKGSYTVSIDANDDALGTYKALVTAIDSSGNVSEKSWDIMVIENKKAKSIAIEEDEEDTEAPVIKLEKSKVSIIVGDNYDITSNIISIKDDKDGTINYSDELHNGVYTITSNLNCNTIGTYTVNITAKDVSGNESSANYDVVVEKAPDITPPHILIYKDNVYITEGSDYSVNSNVMSVTDDVDGTLYIADSEKNSAYTITTDLDTTKTGTYSAHLIAKDSSGNKNTDDWTITVNEKVVATTGSGSSVGYSGGGSPGGAVPSGTSYVVNTNTMKFHRPSCRYAKEIYAENRWDYTGTRDELISWGYVGCKKCNP